MGVAYRNQHLQFIYPDGWEVDETESSDGVTASVQSPASMFVFITSYGRPLAPAELADQALLTMREEYPDLDSTPTSETIAGQPAVGHDVNFFSMDLTNTCWIRAFSAGGRTVLIFAQTNDLELQASERAFRAICASLELNDGSAG